MERLTTRSGFTNEVYLTGKADVCWADRPIEERAFCVGCRRQKGMDRTNCGALMLVDRLAAIEDILCDDTDEYDLDRLRVLCNQRMTMREEVSQRFSLTAKIPLDRLREIAEAERDGRCIALPRLEPGPAGVETAYREFAEDVIRQFGYHGSVNGRPAYTAGGLSTLEEAFRIVEWDDPHPAPECECQEEGCHEWATGGRPTPDGYKWLCGRHFAAYDARKEAEAALAKLNSGT